MRSGVQAGSAHLHGPPTHARALLREPLGGLDRRPPHLRVGVLHQRNKGRAQLGRRAGRGTGAASGVLGKTERPRHAERKRSVIGKCRVLWARSGLEGACVPLDASVASERTALCPSTKPRHRHLCPLDATVPSECTTISPSTQPTPAPLPTPAPHRDLHQQSADQSSSHLSQGHGVAARVRQGDVSNTTQVGRHHGGREPESAANNNQGKGRGEGRQQEQGRSRGVNRNKGPAIYSQSKPCTTSKGEGTHRTAP